jgi:asparagine synthase (glutamine-hydrolysing)
VCGICGEVRFDGERAAVDVVQRMMDAMQARGPDASGLVARGSVAVGHRRLSIIDLSNAAEQPMVDSALGLTIVYNGAIYNYRELRQELERQGQRFYSSGDTEVLLKAYHVWGQSFVERLNGMFAFAIVERDTGRVILARDRLGIKPLYWTIDGKRLRFGSSLPALLAAGDVDTSIDPVALHHYMTFHSVVPAPRTILSGVRKLGPARLMIVEPDGTQRVRQYWSAAFEPGAGDAELTFEDWQARVLEGLRRSVERRLVADVPVGVLLSGGLDSSLVVGLLAEAGQSKLATFSIGFESVGDERGDEFVYSDLIAERFGTDHHRIQVDSRRALPSLGRCIAAMSEPMVSHDAIGFFLLSEEVRQHVKVVQSGQGADEIFAGYHWYPPLLESSDALADYARVFFDRDHAEYARAVTPHWVGSDYSTELVRAHFAMGGARRAVDKALRLDSLVMLVDDPVKRVDNMTMAFGLEARVPFLDHELVELAARIPAEHKIGEGGKHVLKQAARHVIPSEVIDRPKGYFPVPALKYLRGPYLELVREAVTSKSARERGLFRQEYVAELIEQPDAHITPLRGSKLWQIALLELWLQTQHI